MNRVIIKRRPGFVQIDNSVVRDKRISYRARGLLAEMLSQEDEFELNTETLAREMAECGAAYAETVKRKDGSEYDRDLREGRDALRSALRELQAAGYLMRERVRFEDGTFGWVMTLDEFRLSCGQSEESPGRTRDGKSVPGPTRGNTMNAQVAPETDFPAPGNPSSIEEQKGMNTQKTRTKPRSVDNDDGRTPNAAQLKTAQLKAGNGCQSCEETGLTETPAGFVQCRRCDGAGWLAGASLRAVGS